MSDNEAALTNGSLEITGKSKEFRRFKKVFTGRKLVVFGVIVIVSLLLTALFGPIITPHDPYKQNLDEMLITISANHPLGTDNFGRDFLTRLIYGARTSLLVGLLAVGIASSIGMSLGLIAGYFGGKVQLIIMRFIDSLMAFPQILFALTIAAVLGGGLKNIILALGIALMPAYARLMCGQVLSIKENDYITASRSMGASNIHTMFRHVAPNCFPPLIVLMTMMMGQTILAEAGLSFLGIGVEPPGAAWGAMVSEGYEYLLTNPRLSFAPGIAIMLVVFSFNMVGDGLRDALDPRLRGAL